MKNSAMPNIAAGIDIGGTKVRWIIAQVRTGRPSDTPRVRMIVARELPTPKSRAAFDRFLRERFDEYTRRGVNAVGVSVAGHIDAGRHRVVSSRNIPALNGLRVAALPSSSAFRIVLENDARCFAFGEACCGVRVQNVRSALAITLGTGVGRARIDGGAVRRLVQFEYAEPWERGYQQIAKRSKSATALAGFLAPKIAAIARGNNADAIVLGGGRLRVRGLFAELKRELRKNGFAGPVARSHFRQNSAAIGAALFALSSKDVIK